MTSRPAGKKVLLMATCLCDAFFDDVARATVEVLEHVGCEILFPENQTCCGQPPFNGGDWAASRRIVRHTAAVFAGAEPVVVPSGSCAAMLFHGTSLAFAQESDRADVDSLAGRTWELADYLVHGLGIEKWSGKFAGRIAFHRACHTRGTASSPAALQLLESIQGLEIVPFGEGEQCCGFGGTFAVTFPHISSSMGQLKLDHVLAATPDYLVSGDMSCLMHMRGLSERGGRPVEIRHFVQILRDALRA